MDIGAIQKSYHSPEGGGVSRGCEKGVRQGGGDQTYVSEKKSRLIYEFF